MAERVAFARLIGDAIGRAQIVERLGARPFPTGRYVKSEEMIDEERQAKQRLEESREALMAAYDRGVVLTDDERKRLLQLAELCEASAPLEAVAHAHYGREVTDKAAALWHSDALFLRRLAGAVPTPIQRAPSSQGETS